MSVNQEMEQLLLAGNYQKVIDLIGPTTALVNGSSQGAGHIDGNSSALLAYAYFHQENYPGASEYFESALAAEPGNKDWQDMLETSRANIIGDITNPVPDVH